MPKRKNEEDSDYFARKIAKYEKRLAELAKHREADGETNSQHQELDPEIMDDTNEEGVAQDIRGSQTDPGDVAELHESPDSVNADSGELDNEFLLALGESVGGTKQYGPEIHNEIYNTINKILLEGMPKEIKEKLTQTLLVPNNCKLLDAPRLNTELIGVMNNPSKARDKLLEDRQQELGLAIGSICAVINTMSKQEFNKYEIIKKLSDIARILCHLHFQYTEIRRRLVNPFLDKNLVESLKDNKREEFLYSNLDTSVKSYSAMKRAANVIKPKPVHTAKNQHTSKNFHQPPRRLHPANQGYPMRGSYRGAHRYNAPRQPFKPLDNRPAGPSVRGRAKYP
ncbi:uncharacterized protein LOC125241772 [Leguminivora glycinivorella]|uniref:uncharacterized protein LOC125241772 n=1 Tax=Leguminivora glycinivorella TaxID=1035111 RepID=UPI00200F342E|nr:uncharacterized protein LOC125241772 [Leguminivora glycinivorella]